MILSLNRKLYNEQFWNILVEVDSISKIPFETEKNMCNAIILVVITSNGLSSMSNKEIHSSPDQIVVDDSKLDEIYHDLLKDYFVLSGHPLETYLLHKNYVRNNKNYFHMWNEIGDGNFLSPCLRCFDIKQNYDMDICIRSDNDTEISELYGMDFVKELIRCKETNTELAHIYTHAAKIQTDRYNKLSPDLRLLYELSDDKD